MEATIRGLFAAAAVLAAVFTVLFIVSVGIVETLRLLSRRRYADALETKDEVMRRLIHVFDLNEDQIKRIRVKLDATDRAYSEIYKK